MIQDQILCREHYLETVEGETTSSDGKCAPICGCRIRIPARLSGPCVANCFVFPHNVHSRVCVCVCCACPLDSLACNAADSYFGGDDSSKKKIKRVRTAFTEEQLEVLQRNFEIDSNPDGQDLERIALNAGLSKRVTQVWFQNARARQKKHTHLGKRKGMRPGSFTRPFCAFPLFFRTHSIWGAYAKLVDFARIISTKDTPACTALCCCRCEAPHTRHSSRKCSASVYFAFGCLRSSIESIRLQCLGICKFSLISESVFRVGFGVNVKVIYVYQTEFASSQTLPCVLYIFFRIRFATMRHFSALLFFCLWFWLAAPYELNVHLQTNLLV